MYKKFLRAFTLIELLVVITIIGILMGMLMSVVTGVRERARDAKCCANLKQLHTAVLTRFTDGGGGIPAACSTESRRYEMDVNGNMVPVGWGQGKVGWVDWFDYDETDAATDTGASQHGDCKTYWYGDDGIICITNGSLYEYASSDRIYVCPTFFRNYKGPAGERAVRSYVMNSAKGGTIMASDAYRRILFADGAYSVLSVNSPASVLDGNTKRWYPGMDGMLEGTNSPPTEIIGTNHNDKGNVIFLDGHVEKVSSADTANVCEGDWGKY